MTTYTDMLAAYGVTVARPRGMAMTKQALKSFPINGGNVLEVGCGLGETAHFLTNRPDVIVTSIDRHPKMIKKARERNGKNHQIQWLEQDLLHYETPQTFDYCIAESVLSFTPIAKTLEKIHSLLTDHGRLYLLEAVYLGGLNEDEYKEYLNFYGFSALFTEKEWLSQLNKSNFSIQSIIKSEDMIQEDNLEESFSELVLDQNLKQEYVDIYHQHLQLTNKYLAYFDFYYFICEKI